MDRRLKIPAFAGLILAGTASGVALGESAIDQINPLYFQGAPVHPRDRGAALDPSALQAQAQSPRFADLYGWDEGQAARAADCYGCAAVAARDAYAEAPVIQYAVAETGWSEATPAYVPEPAPAEQAEEAAAPSDVEVYAGFQIEEKPAEAEPVDLAAAQE